MNFQFFPNHLYKNSQGICGYFEGAFKAAHYNFKVSTIFDNIQTRTATVASLAFSQSPKIPFNLKVKHFFSHVLVGVVLSVPIVNVFVFRKFKHSVQVTVSSPSSKPVDTTPLQPIIHPKKETSHRVELMETHSMQKLNSSPNSKVLQKAYSIEKNQLHFKQIMLDNQLPILNGQRNNPVSIAEFKNIERDFTEKFFCLFPNETRLSKFASLRKKLDGDAHAVSGVINDDFEYIKSLFLNTEGFTPEVRFAQANINLNALYKFLENKFPHLKGQFYLHGNFKNDMQNSIDSIPYVHLIKILFRFSLDDFLQELNQCNFVLIKALEGEKTPIRIDSLKI